MFQIISSEPAIKPKNRECDIVAVDTFTCVLSNASCGHVHLNLINKGILLSETSCYFNICHMGNCFWIISGSISTPRRVKHICFCICLDAKFWSHCSYSLPVFKCSHCGKAQFLPETPVYTWGESNNCSSFHGCPLCNENTVVVIYLIFQHFLAF